STFREWSRLALATPSQLLDHLLQLLDLASLFGQLTDLLGDLPPELRVLLKELLVSLHLHRELQHISGESTSFRRACRMPQRCDRALSEGDSGKQIPSAFIRTHRKLPVPQRESTLVLVDQASYKMRLYQRGQLRGEYDVSFGQGKGQK